MPKFNWFTMTCLFLASCFAGAAWGAHEAFSHHWSTVHAKFPTISDWWNPEVSWKYKYVDGDPELGRTWVPVQFTDGKHLLFMVHTIGIFISGFIVARMTILRRWNYLMYAGASLAFYWLGNFLLFDLIFG